MNSAATKSINVLSHSVPLLRMKYSIIVPTTAKVRPTIIACEYRAYSTFVNNQAETITAIGHIKIFNKKLDIKIPPRM